MEQNAQGWLGCGSKSDSKHNDYQIKAKETRVSLAVGNLHFIEPFTAKQQQS
jgi:hypothetical protein